MRTLGSFLGAAALLVALSGCSQKIYGAGAEAGVIPPRPPGAMYPNWEYLCHRADSTTLDTVFDEAGMKGWEMTAVVGAYVCFKRPVAPPGVGLPIPPGPPGPPGPPAPPPPPPTLPGRT